MDVEIEGANDSRVAAQLDSVLRHAIANGMAPGYAVKIMRDGRTLYEQALGERDIAGQAPMQLDTRFALASMAKPFTSVAFMQLVEQGKVTPEDAVASHLPQLAGMKVHGGDGSPAGHRITYHQLLTHSSGLSYGAIKTPGSGNIVSDLYYDDAVLHHRVVRGCADSSRTLEEMVTRLARHPLAYEPGTSWEYSIASDVLARAIEVISGQRFDRYLKDHLFDPLGMTHTSYACADRAAMATSYDVDPDGALQANDMIERYLDEPTFYGGGGELLCTAIDYSRFAEMLRGGGSLDGVRILRPESVERMSRNHLSLAQRDELARTMGPKMRPYGFGYGFAVAVESVPEDGVQEGEFFWNGGGGTVNWIDPHNQVTAVVMKHVRFDPHASVIRDLRRALYG
jgi:CubicO group peptidase (beta-lactamase class C family)